MNTLGKLRIVAFISGASIMMVELVGSRILAPYVGTSILIWTSLIGVIMASLSFGYWYGGKLADQNPSIRILSLILVYAALAVGLVAALNPTVLSILRQLQFDLRLTAVIGTLVLFSPASVLLGMVSPFAAKLSLENTKVTGRTIGGLSAISNVGSIVGTFLAGFLLISFFGSNTLLYIIAVVLLATSLFVLTSGDLKTKTTIGIFLLYLAITNTLLVRNAYSKQLVDKDTQYSRVWIVDSNEYSGKPIRLMLINNELSSGMYPGSDELAFSYTKFYQLAEVFHPDFKKTLLIGGAGYSYPKFYLQRYPNATIDVVEIDPGVTELAKTYFGLKEHMNLRIFHEDGRVYLNREPQTYDVILGDAFKSNTVPFHLTTKETVEHMNRMLSDNGVVIINLIGSIEGPKGKFVRASYYTYASVFPQVELYTVENTLQSTDVQNVMLVASKSLDALSKQSLDPQIQELLAHRWNGPIPQDVKILTDDFAPVESYTADIVN